MNSKFFVVLTWLSAVIVVGWVYILYSMNWAWANSDVVVNTDSSNNDVDKNNLWEKLNEESVDFNSDWWDESEENTDEDSLTGDINDIVENNSNSQPKNDSSSKGWVSKEKLKELLAKVKAPRDCITIKDELWSADWLKYCIQYIENKYLSSPKNLNEELCNWMLQKKVECFDRLNYVKAVNEKDSELCFEIKDEKINSMCKSKLLEMAMNDDGSDDSIEIDENNNSDTDTEEDWINGMNDSNEDWNIEEDNNNESEDNVVDSNESTNEEDNTDIDNDTDEWNINSEKIQYKECDFNIPESVTVDCAVKKAFHENDMRYCRDYLEWGELARCNNTVSNTIIQSILIEVAESWDTSLCVWITDEENNNICNSISN